MYQQLRGIAKAALLLSEGETPKVASERLGHSTGPSVSHLDVSRTKCQQFCARFRAGTKCLELSPHQRHVILKVVFRGDGVPGSIA